MKNNKTESWDERVAREKKERLVKSDNSIDHIYDAVNAELTDLGYIVTKSRQSRHGEAQSEQEIKISLPDNDDFAAYVSIGSDYHGAKGELSFNTERCITKESGKYSDGSIRYNTERYKFTNVIHSEKLLELGLEKIDYRIELYQLHKEFKATKNKKLILKDILPKLEIYKSVVLLASPEIDKRIAQENDVLAMQNRLYKHAQHYHGDQKVLKQLNFTVENVGNVQIASSGSIELTMKVTEDELVELIKNKK